MNFTPKRASEIEVFTVDFAPLLAPGETISSPTWTVSVVNGIDENPNAMVTGPASVNGTTSSQKLALGVPGNLYAPICTAQTSLGQTLVLPEAGQGLLYISQ